MKTKLYWILGALLLFGYSVSAQDTIRYFIEIPNSQYVPSILEQEDNSIQLTVDSELRDADGINQALNALEIYGFYDYFSSLDAPNLRNKYIIDLSAESDPTQLVNSFPEYFESIEAEEIFEPLTEDPPQYTPNDFENPDLLENIHISSYDDYEQHDIRMIRAREAWHITKGEPYVIIGVADQGFDAGNGLDPGHEDLASEFVGGLPNYNVQYGVHGNYVAGFASAATDNGLGVSSVGFNTKMIGARGGSISNLLGLAQFDPKPKVVNLSFGSDNSSPNPTLQEMLSAIKDLGVTTVIAGGNGQGSGTGNPSTYYYPASYKDVIAVSTVGNKHDIGSTYQPYDNWKDVHEVYNHSENDIWSHQHNDSIDIVVPAYYPTPVLRRDPDHSDPWKDDYRRVGWGGTSLSAPIVAGTIGLMHSVNFCIDPDEVETILKLTAVVVDTIAENQEFYGRLGAGRLDAYEAVKMAQAMANPTGIVNVKNKVLYRPWFYKLETAPYIINMYNLEVLNQSKVKFRAQRRIEITNAWFKPESGYIDLQINPTLALDCDIPTLNDEPEKINKSGPKKDHNVKVYPTLVEEAITVQDLDELNEMNYVKIYDFVGVVVYEKQIHGDNEIAIDLNGLRPGIYIVKVYNSSNEEIKTSKIIKR